MGAENPDAVIAENYVFKWPSLSELKLTDPTL